MGRRGSSITGCAHASTLSTHEKKWIAPNYSIHPRPDVHLQSAQAEVASWPSEGSTNQNQCQRVSEEPPFWRFLKNFLGSIRKIAYIACLRQFFLESVAGRSLGSTRATRRPHDPLRTQRQLRSRRNGLPSKLFSDAYARDAAWAPLSSCAGRCQLLELLKPPGFAGFQ